MEYIASMQLSGDVVVVMAKYPEVGAVKTRLAPAMGADAACALYRAFLMDLAGALGNGPWRLVWAVQPAGADLTGVVGAGATCIGQVGDGLDERMWQCFRVLFAAGAARVVMIGADLPHLSSAVMAEAFDALGAADVVLLPVRDGGYGLVGMREPRDLFSGIPMSTGGVCAQTLDRARTAGLRVRLLPPSFDVDDAQSLRELETLLADGVVDLPETRRVLAPQNQTAAGVSRRLT